MSHVQLLYPHKHSDNDRAETEQRVSGWKRTHQDRGADPAEVVDGVEQRRSSEQLHLSVPQRLDLLFERLLPGIHFQHLNTAGEGREGECDRQ